MANIDKAALVSVFDDLSLRFFLNLPDSELQSWDRLFFQLELAYWFYLDHCVVDNPNLPAMKLKTFCKTMFHVCVVFKPNISKFPQLYSQFAKYYAAIPVCGCMLISSDGQQVLLVRGVKGKSWGFPRGKINQNESHVQAAIRETQEEVGYDVSNQIREQDMITLTLLGKTFHMFIIKQVSTRFKFRAQASEIGAIQWHSIHDILSGKKNRKNFNNVIPFLQNLKLPKKGKKNNRTTSTGKARGESKQKQTKRSASNPSQQFNNKGYVDETFGQSSNNGWSFEQMMQANKQITGVEIDRRFADPNFDPQNASRSQPHPQQHQSPPMQRSSSRNNRNKRKGGKKKIDGLNEDTFGESEGWDADDMLKQRVAVQQPTPTAKSSSIDSFEYLNNAHMSAKCTRCGNYGHLTNQCTGQQQQQQQQQQQSYPQQHQMPIQPMPMQHHHPQQPMQQPMHPVQYTQQPQPYPYPPQQPQQQPYHPQQQPIVQQNFVQPQYNGYPQPVQQQPNVSGYPTVVSKKPVTTYFDYKNPVTTGRGYNYNSMSAYGYDSSYAPTTPVVDTPDPEPAPLKPAPTAAQKLFPQANNAANDNHSKTTTGNGDFRFNMNSLMDGLG